MLLGERLSCGVLSVGHLMHSIERVCETRQNFDLFVNRFVTRGITVLIFILNRGHVVSQKVKASEITNLNNTDR